MTCFQAEIDSEDKARKCIVSVSKMLTRPEYAGTTCIFDVDMGCCFSTNDLGEMMDVADM